MFSDRLLRFWKLLELSKGRLVFLMGEATQLVKGFAASMVETLIYLGLMCVILTILVCLCLVRHSTTTDIFDPFEIIYRLLKYHLEYHTLRKKRWQISWRNCRHQVDCIPIGLGINKKYIVLLYSTAANAREGKEHWGSAQIVRPPIRVWDAQCTVGFHGRWNQLIRKVDHVDIGVPAGEWNMLFGIYLVYSEFGDFGELTRTACLIPRFKTGDIYIPGTQMTPVLIGKGLLFEGSNSKIEDKQVPGIYIYMCVYIYISKTLRVGSNLFGLLRGLGEL